MTRGAVDGLKTPVQQPHRGGTSQHIDHLSVLIDRTWRLSQLGQFAERYAKAIEQLGNRGSSEDQPTIVEVLVACVREKTRACRVRRTRSLPVTTARQPHPARSCRQIANATAEIRVVSNSWRVEPVGASFLAVS
jgi:hypothetical protein